MGTMRYKPLDKVRIKSLDWYNENKGYTNSIWCEDGEAWFFYHMSQYCGKIMTVKNVWAHSYTLEGSDSRWTDEMIEGLVEEETKPIDLTVKGEEVKERIEITIPEGYEYVIESDKIIFTKKKKTYPKTYEECCKVLNYCYDPVATKTLHKEELIRKFQFLLMYRDAYWKIAGEEMGLGKPWEPDWSIRGYYAIAKSYGKVIKTSNYNIDCTFVFPTEEMRDAFYENFKELIEQCKELL